MMYPCPVSWADVFCAYSLSAPLGYTAWMAGIMPQAIRAEQICVQHSPEFAVYTNFYWAYKYKEKRRFVQNRRFSKIKRSV